MKAKPGLLEHSTTNKNLIALAAEAAEISRLIQEAEGELSPEIEAKLDVNASLLQQKADNYNFIIEHLEAQAALWKRRKDACAAQEKKFSRQVDQLWDRIKLAMKELGTTEISGKLYRYKLRKSQPRLEIDEAQVPPEFKMIIQTTVVDKEKIKQGLQAGFEIPGCKLVESGTLVVTENGEE